MDEEALKALEEQKKEELMDDVLSIIDLDSGEDEEEYYEEGEFAEDGERVPRDHIESDGELLEELSEEEREKIEKEKQEKARKKKRAKE